ncbi:MAG TPA: hypothetical protein VFA26_01090 [Gemmataceae bacterium]|nr:hypothetical protein [Gemmataceae bacterium]
MPTTLTCPLCGARLRVPDNLPPKVKSLRCARCKGSIPLDDFADPGLAPPAAQQPLPPAGAPLDVPLNLSLDAPAPPPPPKASAASADKVRPAQPNAGPAFDDLEVVEDEPLDVIEEVGEAADEEVFDDIEEVEPAGRGDEPSDVPWMLKGNSWFVKPVSGSMFSLSYNVLHGRNRRPIGTAVEKVDALTQVARLFVPRRYLPTRVEVRDSRDDCLVCTIHRPSFFFRARIDIFDPDDRLLGYLEGKIFTLMGGFWVYDAHGREFAEVKGQWRPKPAFHFRTQGGKELGQVMLESTATGKWTVAWFTEGAPWYVQVARSFARDPDAKMLMLGTAVAFDLVRAGQRGATVGVGVGRR